IRRRVAMGCNEVSATTGASVAMQLLGFIANPLVAILLIASVVSAVLGEVANAVIITVIVVLSVVLDFVQSFRSQRAAERLRASVAPLATALRDGRWITLAPRELVEGDIIALKAGDLVPADARLLESRDLHVQQAALTGEALPVEKRVLERPSPRSAGLDAPDLIFLGSSVISGTAMTEVVATGERTTFGDVVARLRRHPPATEFERGLRDFGYLIMRTVFLLVLFVLLVNVALRRDPLESLLFALALAVGLTPEFLPMITTVTLGQGALHMERQKVIVKKLAAIQNFGSIDVLCSDKTGTLTSGRMALEQSLDPAGSPSPLPLELATLNSRFQTGIRSPLDDAVLAAGPAGDGDVSKIDEIPFDFERRRLSVVLDVGGVRRLITKGAPESVLPCCTSYQSQGEIRPLDPSTRGQLAALHQSLAQQGYRVLAVACAAVPRRATYTPADEAGLTLAGFLAFSDPLLPDAAEALATLRADGVRVMVLTGDNEAVARHACAAAGIDAGRIMLGEELERRDDRQLQQLVEDVSVFARVTPGQKDRVILALKRAGHVVGYLGDGINDAPSLHTADVGISVVNGTDVARDVADIILLEPGLRVLQSGIIEGRKAFGNVVKYLLMGTSSNFGNMFSMAAATLFLPFLPMLPTQILLNNFLYDLAQITIPTDTVDPMFIRQPHRWDIRLIRNFMLLIGPISSLYDFLTFFVLLKIFDASAELFHTGWFIESLVTQTLVLLVIRTAGTPWRSRPSTTLALTLLAVILVAIALPFTPLAGTLGFVALPATYFLFLLLATLTYLALVEVVKRPLLRRYWGRA
ncbi:MAG TPA: magnesium-translocating P-type ATPase, partial [Nitrolancea sp.]|nr:magnesium-translocating P-type ATPase [Nitrolancea sp.]